MRHPAPASPSGCRRRSMVRVNRHLSSETIHASTVAMEGRAVLISGPSGSGKSDLALRLLDRGFSSSATTRRSLRREGDRLIASAPPTIAGKLEIRGIGIVDMDTRQRRPDRPLCRAHQRDHAPARTIGANARCSAVKLPLVSVDAMTASRRLEGLSGTRPAGPAILDSDGVQASQPPRLLLVTGMSGAGKSSVLDALEDMGWDCVDNLPVSLLNASSTAVTTNAGRSRRR